MGCAPTIGLPTAVQPVDQNETNNHIVFTMDEKLKIKEVWVIAKQNNLKKLGEELMTKALEKNPKLIDYWHNAAFLNQANNLNFGESESLVNTDLISKQAFKHHGYKILEAIDHIIMIMVTRVTATNSNDNILNEHFQRIAEAHSEYTIKQDHIDIISETLMGCLKDLMYHNETEWTIKHELTWMKLFTLITNPFLSPTKPKS